MPAYAFEGPKWQPGPITWSFAEFNYSIDDAQDKFSASMSAFYQTLVIRAVNEWSSVSGLIFTQVLDSQNVNTPADIRIGFGDLDSVQTGTIGETETQSTRFFSADEIVRLEDPAQLALNDAGGDAFPGSNLTYAGTASTFYQVVLHEIGHALGLAHSTDPSAVMFKTATPDNRDLNATDVAGIRALYDTQTLTVSLPDNVILFQNDDGSAAVWQMKGIAIIGGGLIGLNPGTAWLARGSGDFNGDGLTDILWQNANGTAAIWDMDGANIIGGGIVDLNPGPSWHVVATADFNHDGRSDIVWQNDNGALDIWFMNGSNISAVANVGFNPGTAWHAVGTGDFYGDGHNDILWQDNTGSLVVWNLSGSTVVGGGAIALNPGPSWHVKGIADLNGDGRSDIVWQNDDGTAAVWNMNGTAIAGGGLIGFKPGPSWHLKGAADYGNDRQPELLWQNDNGNLAIWSLSGTAIVSGGTIGVTPGESWHALGSDGMRFINGSSNSTDATVISATPGPDEFVFTSALGGLRTISGFDPAQDIVELSRAIFTDFAHVQAVSKSIAGGTLFFPSTGGALQILSTPPSSLHASNFVFV